MTNPALADLAPLVGQWRMEVYGAAFLPDLDTRVTGSVEFDWIENGAAVVMRQGADYEGSPAAVWIIGRAIASGSIPASRCASLPTGAP